MNNADSMAVTVTRDQGKEIYNNSYKPCGGDKAQYQNGNLDYKGLSGATLRGRISANLVYFKGALPMVLYWVLSASNVNKSQPGSAIETPCL